MRQVLIIVPSRELTVQTVMLAFRLTGGSVNAGVPGADNMFNYTGPQGLKVGRCSMQRVATCVESA